MLPGLTFVLGTAGSGKAGFAKILVTDTGRGPVCILTAPSYDPAAQSSLTGRETDWTTLHAPRDIGRMLAGVSGDIISTSGSATDRGTAPPRLVRWLFSSISFAAAVL